MSLIEKERRFLIPEWTDFKFNKIEQIQQRYHAVNEYLVLRSRLSARDFVNYSYVLCIKHKGDNLGDSEVVEIEKGLTGEEYKALSHPLYSLDKIRYTLITDIDDVAVVTCDCFEKDLLTINEETYAIVEVELRDPSTDWDDVQLPNWLTVEGEEITGLKEYSNVSLAKKSSGVEG